MLTRLKPGQHKQDLLQAVESCKGFLFRLQPEVYVVTRLDIHYPREGPEPPYPNGLIAGIRRLVSLRPSSRRTNQVRVVHLEPQGYQRPHTSMEAQALELMRWEVKPLSEAIRRSGASVLRWDPLQQDFASAFLRHLNAGR